MTHSGNLLLVGVVVADIAMLAWLWLRDLTRERRRLWLGDLWRRRR